MRHPEHVRFAANQRRHCNYISAARDSIGYKWKVGETVIFSTLTRRWCKAARSVQVAVRRRLRRVRIAAVILVDLGLLSVRRVARVAPVWIRRWIVVRNLWVHAAASRWRCRVARLGSGRVARLGWGRVARLRCGRVARLGCGRVAGGLMRRRVARLRRRRIARVLRRIARLLRRVARLLPRIARAWLLRLVASDSGLGSVPSLAVRRRTVCGSQERIKPKR